jgi:hypothetical protein
MPTEVGHPRLGCLHQGKPWMPTSVGMTIASDRRVNQFATWYDFVNPRREDIHGTMA